MHLASLMAKGKANGAHIAAKTIPKTAHNKPAKNPRTANNSFIPINHKIPSKSKVNISPGHLIVLVNQNKSIS